MMRPTNLAPRLCARLSTVLLAGALALPGAAAPSREPQRSPAPAPIRPSRPGAARPIVPPPPPRGHFKRPTAFEMQQFYAELKAGGWPEPVVAAIPTAYVRSGRDVLGVGTQFATFYGDVDGDRQPEWVLGCYVQNRPMETRPDQPNSMIPAQDDRARIVVFKKKPGGPWRAVWRSPGLGSDFSTPRHNIQEVEAGLEGIDTLLPPMALVDVDGDRCLEIAYHCRSQLRVVGQLPGVLRHDGGRWRGVAPQADRFSLQDLNNDGKLELVTGTPYVGYGQGDDDVPRVWRWSGKQYLEASSQYPAYYAALSNRYADYVKQREQRGESFNRAAWQRAIQKARTLAG